MKRLAIAALLVALCSCSSQPTEQAASPTTPSPVPAICGSKPMTFGCPGSPSPVSPSPSPVVLDHSAMYCQAHPEVVVGCPLPKPPPPSPKPNPDQQQTEEICRAVEPAIFGPPSRHQLALQRITAWHQIALTMNTNKFYVRLDVLLLWESTTELFPTPAIVHSDAVRLASDCEKAGVHTA